MTLKIDTCPFCGGQPDFENTEERARLRCRECGAESGVFFYSEEERESGIGAETENRCAEAWNRRVSVSAEPVAIANERAPWVDLSLPVGYGSMKLYSSPQPQSADAQDAARYRWLRANHPIHDNSPFICRNSGSSFSQWTGEHADSAIDEAMAKEKTT